MNRIRRQSIRGASFLYLGQLIGIVNKLILFPLVFLGNESYWGILSWFYSIAFLSISLATWGFPKVLVRFLPVYKRESKQIILFVLKFSAAGLGILLSVLFLAGDRLTTLNKNPDLVQENYPILILILISFWFFELGGSIFQSRFKSSIPLFVNNVIIRISTSILLLCMYWFNLNVSSFLWIQAISYVLIHGGLFLFALRNEHIFDAGIDKGNDKLEYSEFKRFASFSAMNSLSAQGVKQLDSFLLGGMLPFAFSAILDALKNITSVVEMPSRAILQSSAPVIVECIHQSNNKALKNIYYKTSMVQFSISAILFLFIVFNSDWIFNLVPTQGFDLIPDLILITGIGKLVDSLTGANSTIIGNSKHYKFNLYSSLYLLGLLVVLQLILIPRLELMGAAIGMASGTIIINIVRSLYLFKKEGWHPFRPKHFSVVLFFSSLIFLAYNLKPIELSFNALIINMIFVLIVSIFMIWIKPIEEIELLLKKLKNPLKFPSKGF